MVVFLESDMGFIQHKITVESFTTGLRHHIKILNKCDTDIIKHACLETSTNILADRLGFYVLFCRRFSSAAIRFV